MIELFLLLISIELAVIFLFFGVAISKLDVALRQLSLIKIYVMEIYRTQNHWTYSASPSPEPLEEEDEM